MTRKPSSYFKGRKCCICGSDRTYINRYDTPVWSICRCNKKDCTKFICHSCEHKRYEKESYNSLTNWRKRAQDCRIGNIDIENERGKSILIEMVVAKVRKLENYNIKTDNFNAKFDLSIDPEYGKPQVKGPALIGLRWDTKLGMEHNFDSLWIICMDRNRHYIKRVYIIPESELYGETAIYINEELPKRGYKFEWVEKYRVDEEPYNYAYHSLITYIGNKKRIDINDLIEWLEMT